MLQVVAGVVLAQRAQLIQHAAVGQHHFQAECQVARVAVAQHLLATRIGGHHATDRGAALGGQRQGKQAAHVRGRLLRSQHGAAGLKRHAVVQRVHAAHRRHAVQA
ncbi:hypothetical protein D3C78_1686670 [compost metagenome]